MASDSTSGGLLGTAAAAVPSTVSRLELVRSVWTLAWPAILSFGLESLVGLVDMLMVGRLGAAAIAGVGVGTQILYAVHVVVIAVATGTVALVARHVGAGEPRAAENALLQSLYAAALITLAVAIPVFWGAREAVAVFGVEPAVVDEGTGYVRYVMLGMPFFGLFAVFGAGFRGAGDMRTPLVLGAVVNVLNVVGNYVLIFGKLGLPAMGVRGCALASTISFVVGALLALAVLLRRRSVLRLRPAHLGADLQMARRVMAVGMPTAIEQLLMQIGFVLYLMIAAGYGTSAVAAYFIGVRILALSFLPGFGFGAAASTIVGQQLGAGRPRDAERGGWEANRLAVLLMSIGGALIFLGARPIAQLFIDDAQVVDDAVSFIRILAVAQPLMATDFALGGALRGAGDTRFPLLTVVVGFYGARLGLAMLAAWVWSLSLTWVWLALLGDYAVRSALKAWRFRSGRWQQMAV